MKLRATAPLTLMLKVNEIFRSIQGESTHTGRVCTFIRLTGCNLRCSYCDTEYAFYEGEDFSISEILEKIELLKCNLVEITGGEPLLQDDTTKLIELLIAKNYEVLVETNGSLDISNIPKPAIKIVDIKCPDSQNENSFQITNINYLTKKDECKFVISSESDFKWAINFVESKRLTEKSTVIFSPNTNSISATELAEKVSKLNCKIRFGMQIHKTLWGNRQGV